MILPAVKQMAISLIDEAVAAGARRHKACAVLGICCRTLRRWRAAATLTDQRKGAAKACPHALGEIDKARILEACNAPQYRSLPPSQIVPRLADQGTYIASESSFYRVLKAHGQAQRRGRTRPPRTRTRPASMAATAPNRVWSWDITYLPTAIKGQFHRLYLIMDIYSRKIVGWEVHQDELSIHAGALIEKACLRQRVPRQQLTLHSDNGSPMKGATMLATLQRLGVVPSFSRPSVSDDNPYSESLFRTLKYSPAYPAKAFEDIDQARRWVARFVQWYNHEHRHSGIRFVTPAQRHGQQDRQILATRRTVYEAAKRAYPDRWRGRAVRNWEPITTVWLNPEKPAEAFTQTMPIAA